GGGPSRRRRRAHARGGARGGAGGGGGPPAPPRGPGRAGGAGPAGRGGAPRRVLIVEDDEHIRESLREAFEDEGYEAATAANGGEALDMLRQTSPRYDVAILDLVLPVLDGASIYRAMQADPSLASIPVIVSTANPTRA